MALASPFIFLSHSGADTEAARELRRRLLTSPESKKAGLKVWFDQDDLRPGTPWSAQLADAIQNDATAFLVYVGSSGVMNWVDAEVELAISRTTTSKPKPLLFIPVLAAEGRGAEALPPFAKRYQGVRDPLGNSDELAKLLKAVLDLDSKTTPILIDEPFVGLRAMREEESDRFFGRKAEITALVEKFGRHRIVAVVADSGTGKSSLARAGFAPAFRGGALIDPVRAEARDKIWQVVTMRLRTDPVEGLRQAIESAAQKLGRSLADTGSLRDIVSIADAGKTAFALRCGLPPDKTSTLLIVDQFEELFTTTSDKEAAAFAALLLALADGASDIRILLTVRSDYLNLASGLKDATGRAALFERLTADNNDAILRLKAMSPAGLREAVLEPLKLAGERNETSLADAVQTDISHQASDLPLLQVALRAAWQEHKSAGRPMIEAYQTVGRVSGALAREADKARDKLPKEDRDRLESIFVRLVRLGDTGGATRRDAGLDEFDPPSRDLLRTKLGNDEYGRLVSIGETHVELAHEALITQWPWLQDMLKTNATDVRWLARLMERTKEWSASPEERKANYLATGAEREEFHKLKERRGDWFSEGDRDFVTASERAYQDDLDAKRATAEARQREREEEQVRQIKDAKKLAAAASDLAASEQRTSRRTRIGAVGALLFAIAAGAFGMYARYERSVADEKTVEANARTLDAIKAKGEADKAAQIAENQKAEAERQKAEAESQKAETERQKAGAERELLRAQTAELRAMVERLDILRSSSADVEGLDRERAQVMERLEKTAHSYREKLAKAIGFRGDLDWIMKLEGTVGGVKLWNSDVLIDPGTTLNYMSPQVIEKRYAFLLTPDELNAVLSVVGKKGEEAVQAYGQHRAILERIQLKPTDVAQLVPEAVQPYWAALLKQNPGLSEASTPGAAQTALLSLAFNVGLGNRVWKSLAPAIAARDWSQVANLIENMKESTSSLGLKRRRIEEANLIRSEIK